MSHISAQLPFTEEDTDPLFIEGRDRLKSRGNPIDEHELHHIYLECRDNIVHSTELFGRFWERFQETDKIDVSVSAKCLYNLLFVRVELPVVNMSKETADRSFRLLTARENQYVAQATNEFLNAMIRELKRPNPLLSLMAV